MEISQLYQFVLALVMVGLTVGVGLVVLGQFRTNLATGVANCTVNSTGGTGATILYTGCGADYNATQQTITAIGTIPTTWLGLIVTIVVVSVILAIVIKSFSGGGQR
jgi:hypothetical protein